MIPTSMLRPRGSSSCRISNQANFTMFNWRTLVVGVEEDQGVVSIVIMSNTLYCPLAASPMTMRLSKRGTSQRKKTWNILYFPPTSHAIFSTLSANIVLCFLVAKYSNNVSYVHGYQWGLYVTYEYSRYSCEHLFKFVVENVVCFSNLGSLSLYMPMELSLYDEDIHVDKVMYHVLGGCCRHIVCNEGSHNFSWKKLNHFAIAQNYLMRAFNDIQSFRILHSPPQLLDWESTHLWAPLK